MPKADDPQPGHDEGPREPRRLPVRPPVLAGLVFLGCILAACLLSLPWTMSPPAGEATPRYNAGSPAFARLPPVWIPLDREQRERFQPSPTSPTPARRALLGTDNLGRSVLVRCLTGGGISLAVGLLAATISVGIGTLYGAVAGWKGGRTDAAMMRIVDVLYGLPSVLLVVLLAVAVDAASDDWAASRRTTAAAQRASMVDRSWNSLPESERSPAKRTALEDSARAAHPDPELSAAQRNAISVGTLLIAIGGVSWLTMARVVRGQVMSLRARPFVEAARAIGVPPARIFLRHILPNLAGTIVVYATLTVPQAILQESFLSFLGIGIKPPLPSWGNMASDGLAELNPFRSNWWLLAFPCGLIACTLLALNFVGEGLREALDPRRTPR